MEVNDLILRGIDSKTSNQDNGTTVEIKFEFENKSSKIG